MSFEGLLTRIVLAAALLWLAAMAVGNQQQLLRLADRVGRLEAR